MFAVIKTGGKQYLVKENDVLEIEKIDKAVKDKIVFDKILLVFDENGEKVIIGQPFIEKAKVEAEILEQKKGKKIKIIKFKRKTRYRRKKGHRQLLTKVKILRIICE
jgi:large subunit ribosomal protein L21